MALQIENIQKRAIKIIFENTRGMLYSSALYCANLPSLQQRREQQPVNFYRKRSYRRGTARHSVSVKTVLNVAQMFVELHLISPALGE